MISEVITPPVTIILIPEKYGARGYGCKRFDGNILIPYNKAVLTMFDDVKERKIMTMERSAFFRLESCE